MFIILISGFTGVVLFISIVILCFIGVVLFFTTIHLLHAGGGNMKIYSPKSIIFLESNARGEYNTRG
jgi:hypothetical protein